MKLNTFLKTLESIAGMLILAAIGFSSSIGIWPSYMLYMAGMIIFIGSTKKKFIQSFVVAIVLSLPLIYQMFGKEGKYIAVYIALVLSLIWSTTGGGHHNDDEERS